MYKRLHGVGCVGLLVLVGLGSTTCGTSKSEISCQSDAGCPTDQPFCHPERQVCVQCTGDQHCNDQNQCTTDGCANDSCQHAPVSNGTNCNDGDGCTRNDACQAGSCQGALWDDDGDSFAPEACGGTDCDDADAAVNPNATEGPPTDPSCSDGIDNNCDGRIDQQSVDCVPCAQDADCNDQYACTTDTCSNQVCQHSPAPNGTLCNDRDGCTMDDACQAGQCTGQPLDDDGDGHVADACGGQDCDDADATIHPGATEGPQGDPTCGDGADNDCDGDVDGADPGCTQAACAQDSDCDDSNSCTTDNCAAGQCQNAAVADGTGCDDGDDCTMNDACTGGQCRGDRLDADGDGVVAQACGGRDCDDSNPNVNPGAAEGPAGDATCTDSLDNDCDRLADGLDPECITCTVDTDCGDSNECTVDTCRQTVCVNQPAPRGTPCDDGDACTETDQCRGGWCDGRGMPDVDNDGFAPVACGGGDCDDNDDTVNPAAQEGPMGDASCTDGKDNDCDGQVDTADPNCGI